MFNTDLILTNQLLSNLISVSQHLLPYLKEVSLVSGQTIHEAQSRITKVYFPQGARLSLVLVMSDCSITEVTSIGNEGLVGLPIVLGSDSTNTRSIVQMSGSAIELSANILKTELQKNQEFRRLLLLYAQVQFSQVSQIAACRTQHDIEQRLARWLLLIYDSTQYDTLPLTQKFISLMLGVRRASITEIAISFQKQGIIKYSRGQIKIVNRSKLELLSCECYDKIKFEYQRLLENTFLN